MFKKAIFGLVLLFSSLFSDASLGVIGNHGYIEFDTVEEFNQDQGKNWVAVYKKGDSTDWDNVLRWSWIKDLSSHGEKTYDFEFDDLESGKVYELRFFYDNSYDIAQSVDFTFSGSKSFLQIEKYDTDTLNLISSNIDLNSNSWVGIYEKGKSNAWDNVIGWNWVDSTTANDKDYRSTIEGLNLVDGVYDVRLFYNNSFDLKASVELVVDTIGNAQKVTRAELDVMIANGEDYSGVDVSGIRDMSGLFRNKEVKFDITGWDVSNVTDMSYMFSYSFFNQPIGNWDVSSVTNMRTMFYKIKNFNQPIGYWDVGNVTNMSSMFYRSEVFNQPIGDWNVGNVTNMSYMFSKTKNFNQPIGNWNVSNVTNMSGMFYLSEVFNQPIGNWNVGNVTNMVEMFRENSFFNQPIGDWDVSKVTNMAGMFQSSRSFNQPIGDWDVSRVNNMPSMFSASKFNQPIGDWDVSNVTSMGKMFFYVKHFNQPIGNWDVSNVNNMAEMFTSAKLFNQDISSWDVSKVIRYYDFADRSLLQESYKPHFQ